MNYTEKYHLPQWEETDRIMRTDFNQMCADMEAGLAANAQGAVEALQNNNKLDQRTLERLRRLAYNHYTAVQDMDPFPWQVGVFHQNPMKDGSGVTGGIQWKGVYFSTTNPAAVTLGGLKDYMEEVSPMELVKNDLAACTALKVNISVPVSAYVNKIDLGGNVINNTPNTPFPVRLTLVDLDTGEPEASYLLDFTQTRESISLLNGLKDAFLIFHAGQHYQIQMEPLAAAFSGNLHLCANEVSAPLFSAPNASPINAVHTMREIEGSSCGLLIVRGVVFGEGLTVKWDGQTVPLQTTRVVQVPGGQMVREMVYFRSDPIPAETAFSLHFDSNMPGSFLFYDWGAVLL